MPTLNVWLIRHGESTLNAGEVSIKPEDAPLTQKGKEQAKRIAEHIFDRPDLIIVSPLRRAQQSVSSMCKRWPDTSVEIWPIQEFIYLSPSDYKRKSITERQAAVCHYWQQALPTAQDGKDTESFAQFIERLRDFHHRLCKHSGFIVVMGHGQFFKAYQLGLEIGFEATSEWMKTFRERETTHPILNGEIIKLDFDDTRQCKMARRFLP